MGYTIRYIPGEDKVVYKPVKKRKIKLWISAVVIVCLICVWLWNPVALDEVKVWLLPGDAAITEAATLQLITDLQNGQKISEAFTAFCLHVIEGAQCEVSG